jgi:hypothetical protein
LLNERHSGWSRDAKTGFLEDLPCETLGDELAFLDHTSRERPEGLLSRCRLVDEENLTATPDDGDRDVKHRTHLTRPYVSPGTEPGFRRERSCQ